MDTKHTLIYKDAVAFLEELYHQSTFNIARLNNIHKKVVEILSHSDELESELAKDFFFLTNRLSTGIIAHFDPNDLFDIKEYSEIYYVYLDRCFFLMDQILSRDLSQIADYEDDIGTFFE